MDIIKNVSIKVELRNHEYDTELKELLRFQLCSIFYGLINKPIKYNEVKISLSSKDFSSEVSEDKILVRANWEYFTNTESPFFKLGVSKILKLVDESLVFDDSVYDKILLFDGNENVYSLLSLPLESNEKSIIKLLDDFNDSTVTILNKNKDYLFTWNEIKLYFNKTKDGYFNRKICIED